MYPDLGNWCACILVSEEHASQRISGKSLNKEIFWCKFTEARNRVSQLLWAKIRVEHGTEECFLSMQINSLSTYLQPELSCMIWRPRKRSGAPSDAGKTNNHIFIQYCSRNTESRVSSTYSNIYGKKKLETVGTISTISETKKRNGRIPGVDSSGIHTEIQRKAHLCTKKK